MGKQLCKIWCFYINDVKVFLTSVYVFQCLYAETNLKEKIRIFLGKRCMYFLRENFLDVSIQYVLLLSFFSALLNVHRDDISSRAGFCTVQKNSTLRQGPAFVSAALNQNFSIS